MVDARLKGKNLPKTRPAPSVTWKQIRPFLPPSWTPIGVPREVPEGALFIVSRKTVPGTVGWAMNQRREYCVIRYNSDPAKQEFAAIEHFQPDPVGENNRGSVFATAEVARRAVDIFVFELAVKAMVDGANAAQEAIAAAGKVADKGEAMVAALTPAKPKRKPKPRRRKDESDEDYEGRLYRHEVEEAQRAEDRKAEIEDGSGDDEPGE